MRGRRQDRREERQDDRSFGRRGRGNTRYQMREKLVSIGDDFWIENEQGQKAFKVDGKALRVRQTLKFENAQGQELCQIQERMLRVKESMEVEDAHGKQVAMVKKADKHALAKFTAAMALAILAYKGFTTITNSGAEIVDPHRNVGCTIMISIPRSRAISSPSSARSARPERRPAPPTRRR